MFKKFDDSIKDVINGFISEKYGLYVVEGSEPKSPAQAITLLSKESLVKFFSKS